MILIWFQDFKTPFYIAQRVGLHGEPFRIIKLRTMIYEADAYGVNSTSSDDKRITHIGHFIRRYKLDELPQLINVLFATMSLVGPRPQVKQDTDRYTKVERHLLDVKPGITDLSSIVFSDEGDILKGSIDPDLTYNRIIRPWKSRLGLLYIKKQSFFLDLWIIILTLISFMSKEKALKHIESILIKWNANHDLIEVSRRKSPPYYYPPP